MIAGKCGVKRNTTIGIIILVDTGDLPATAVDVMGGPVIRKYQRKKKDLYKAVKNTRLNTTHNFL